MKNYIDMVSVVDIDDAYDFMDKQMSYFKSLGDDWFIHEASIRHVNGGWIAGVMFVKGQMELDF